MASKQCEHNEAGDCPKHGSNHLLPVAIPRLAAMALMECGRMAKDVGKHIADDMCGGDATGATRVDMQQWAARFMAEHPTEAGMVLHVAIEVAFEMDGWDVTRGQWRRPSLFDQERAAALANQTLDAMDGAKALGLSPQELAKAVADVVIRKQIEKAGGPPRPKSAGFPTRNRIDPSQN